MEMTAVQLISLILSSLALLISLCNIICCIIEDRDFIADWFRDRFDDIKDWLNEKKENRKQRREESNTENKDA